MKKLLAAVGVVVVLLALALTVGSIRWRPSRRNAPPRAEESARGAGPLLAGAAVVQLEPAGPVAVAGFPRLHWMDEGRRDPVAARAVVLQEPGCTVALVSVEILLVPAPLQRAIERKVRDLRIDRVIVAATHTHAGPGDYWDEPLGERLATGPYRDDVFQHIATRAAEAVRQAHAALEPAYLAAGVGSAPALARNRSGQDVDGRLVSIRILARRGPTLARIVSYPAHATLLGVENRLVSGDWPGAFMRETPEPLLFFQGALGDQAPRMPTGFGANPEMYARALHARLEAVPLGPADPWPELGFATATAVLPAPVPGATPPLLRRIARNLLYDWFPARAAVTALQLGPITFLAVPGEPVATVARRWREAAGPGAEVLALAGDYVGYVETSERMAEAAGETVRTYYGPDLAARLEAALRVAARGVGLTPNVNDTTAAVQKRTTAPPPGSQER